MFYSSEDDVGGRERESETEDAELAEVKRALLAETNPIMPPDEQITNDNTPAQTKQPRRLSDEE